MTDSTRLQHLIDDPALEALVTQVRQGGVVSARGAVGSSTSMIAATLQHRLSRPVLLVCAHIDDADEACDELDALGTIAVQRFPAMEVVPGETRVSVELAADRLRLMQRLDDPNGPPDVIVAPIQALMQAVPNRDQIPSLLRSLAVGDTVDQSELVTWLADAGYDRVESIDTAGEFAVRGGIIDIFPPGGVPARVDLFGDEIDAIHEVDLDTMGSDRRIDRLELVGGSIEQLLDPRNATILPALLPNDTVAVLAELLEIREQARSYFERIGDARSVVPVADVMESIGRRSSAVLDINHYSTGAAPERAVAMPVEALPAFAQDVKDAVAELAEIAGRARTTVLCQNDGEAQRMRELLDEFAPEAPVEIETRYLHRGYIWTGHDGAPASAHVPYHELLNRFVTRRQVRRLGGGRKLDTFLELEPGDAVVHRDHGIAKFIGLQTIKGATGVPEEFLTLEFARKAQLHVPASRIELVQKYVGGFHGKPELSVLGGKKWKAQKEKVSDAVRDLAAEMLRIQAARSSLPGIRYPADTPWQHEFEAEFPYQETEDQMTAIVAVKKDMGGAQPMDRLICGDVGFGKTEVAIRAAFKAVEFGKQVAVLVPTTVLAEQHERTFRERFADYPFRIESISRFKTKKQQTLSLEALRRGQVDIIIGTHRLLSQDVVFSDLGLVVIDEEQRFGVEHKQRLLSLRMTADILTLSATPIPRTLHMAMLGLRDISSLSTPPPDRRAIVTEVMGYDSRRVKQAIRREMARDGQVYFVHNRVHNIQTFADDIQRLVPDARIIVGHGQMPTRQLESVMLKFLRREADVLVCTTIIESGIDIPTANTMFINDAHRFGLSELHQLRGRVGRHKHRAYCYMLLPQDTVLSEVAVKRLRAIESFSMLGAGFRIALRDMEIRGVGNLLGAEQSGHIAAVGYEMYCQLLERAVNDLKNERPVSSLDTLVDLGISGAIPKGYIPSNSRRMDAYRRINRADSITSLQQVEHDLVSAYGDLPKAASALLELAEIRLHATTLGIRSLVRHEQDLIFRTTNPTALESQMKGAQGSLRVVGRADAQGITEIYYRPPKAFLEPGTLLTVLRRRLRPATQEAASAATTAVGS